MSFRTVYNMQLLSSCCCRSLSLFDDAMSLSISDDLTGPTARLANESVHTITITSHLKILSSLKVSSMRHYRSLQLNFSDFSELSFFCGGDKERVSIYDYLSRRGSIC